MTRQPRMGGPLSRSAQRCLLVGAGHAHLHLIRHAARLRDAGARVTVIDPGEFWYSGLATGMLGGMYARDDDVLPVPSLAASTGVEFVAGRVESIDRATGHCGLADGRRIEFDLLSLNVGSRTDLRGMDIEPAANVFTVKPISGLWELRQQLERRLRRGQALRAVVVGGGSTGCEIAANLEALGRRYEAELSVALVHGDRRLLAEHPPDAGRIVERSFAKRGISLQHSVRAERADGCGVTLSDGSRVEVDYVVLASGLSAAPLAAQADLSTDEDGRMHTSSTLQSVDDERIFGAGDCIQFDGQGLPYIGVYGVRQSRVLLDNILATLRGEPPRVYTPQKRFLSILNLGDGTGLAVRGRRVWHSRVAMWWKNWLDTRFLDAYRTR